MSNIKPIFKSKKKLTFKQHMTNLKNNIIKGAISVLTLFKRIMLNGVDDFLTVLARPFKTKSIKLSFVQNLKLYGISMLEIFSTFLANKKLFLILTAMMSYLIMQELISTGLLNDTENVLYTNLNLIFNGVLFFAVLVSMIKSRKEKNRFSLIDKATFFKLTILAILVGGYFYQDINMLINGVILACVIGALFNFNAIKNKENAFLPARKISLYALLFLTMCVGVIISYLSINILGLIVPFDHIYITDSGIDYSEYADLIMSNTAYIFQFMTLLITTFLLIMFLIVYSASLIISVSIKENGFYNSSVIIFKTMFRNIISVLFNIVFLITVIYGFDFIEGLFDETNFLFKPLATLPLLLIMFIFYGNYISKVSNLLLPTTKKEK